MFKAFNFNEALRQLHCVFVEHSQAATVATGVSDCEFSGIEFGVEDVRNHAFETHESARGEGLEQSDAVEAGYTLPSVACCQCGGRDLDKELGTTRAGKGVG